MKHRALKRLEHKLLMLHEYFERNCQQEYRFKTFNYNMEDKDITPEQLLARAIHQIRKAIEREEK